MALVVRLGDMGTPHRVRSPNTNYSIHNLLQGVIVTRNIALRYKLATDRAVVKRLISVRKPGYPAMGNTRLED